MLALASSSAWNALRNSYEVSLCMHKRVYLQICVLNFIEIWMQITKKLGSATPVITSFASGIIGGDAMSEEFTEVNLFLLILVD